MSIKTLNLNILVAHFSKHTLILHFIFQTISSMALYNLILVCCEMNSEFHFSYMVNFELCFVVTVMQHSLNLRLDLCYV